MSRVENVAYRFESALTIEAMLPRLNEQGPWKWTERDNDRWGDYLSVIPVGAPPRVANVRIFVEPEHQKVFVVELELRLASLDADADREFRTSTHDTLFNRLLPAVRARELRVAEIDSGEA